MDLYELVLVFGVLFLILSFLWGWFGPKVGIYVFRRFGIRKRWLAMPANFCPKCEHTALKLAYHVFESYPRPTPNYYLCKHCGARWKRLFDGPLEDATAPEHDYYYDPNLSYQYRGEPDNGNESMEVVPFEPNWVKCPNCGWRFPISRKRRPGQIEMHSRCGQLLKVLEQDFDSDESR